MNVKKQGEDECMLATIAALSRVPLHKVRQMALTIANKKKWRQVVQNHPLYWRTIKKLSKEVGLLERKIPDKKRYNKGNRKVILPKGIEGSICTESPNSILAHIDPFSNGKVYGTNDEKPLTIQEYRAWIESKNGRITGIWY